MDHDERERRDLPDDDRGEAAPEPDWTASSHEDTTRPADAEGWRNTEQPDRVVEESEASVDPSGTAASDVGGTDAEADTERGAPSEIESWPSQEPVGGTDRPWPTEPPAADSGGESTWPTAAPERAGEPAPGEQPAPAEPSWPSEERAPEEVEAYPAAGAPAEDASAVAASAHAVPDAEGTTGESTQCPRCGTENRPGLSFCRNCGQRLVAAGASSTVERPGAPEGTMACPRCGTHNRAGVAFCQNCGANLRGTAEGYVPPAAAEEERPAAEPARRGAILGPVVLLIGLAGLVTAYLLPFLYGSGNSLFDRAWGSDGYGIAFWNGYPEVNATLADQAYFGLTGPVPILGVILLALAIAGFVRAAPGPLQIVGLFIALLWSVGLVVLFVIAELAANWDGDLVGVLRILTPAGIIFFLSSLIVLIGTLTRFSRG